MVVVEKIVKKLVETGPGDKAEAIPVNTDVRETDKADDNAYLSGTKASMPPALSHDASPHSHYFSSPPAGHMGT